MIVPPIIWIMLGKNDKNYFYLSFAILAVGMIPTISGSLILTDLIRFKKTRFVGSFFVSALTYVLWVKYDAKVINELIQNNQILSLANIFE